MGPINRDMSANFLDEAYKRKHKNLESLLQKIELEIENCKYIDKTLLKAKMIVTSKIRLLQEINRIMSLNFLKIKFDIQVFTILIIIRTFLILF